MWLAFCLCLFAPHAAARSLEGAAASALTTPDSADPTFTDECSKQMSFSDDYSWVGEAPPEARPEAEHALPPTTALQLLQSSAASLEQCMAPCSSDPSCDSVAYDAARSACELRRRLNGSAEAVQLRQERSESPPVFVCKQPLGESSALASEESCGGLSDGEDSCHRLAARGDCEMNKVFMKSTCSLSCCRAEARTRARSAERGARDASADNALAERRGKRDDELSSGFFRTSSKVFCLGTGKTGTETLSDIFEVLKMSPCHHQCENTPSNMCEESWAVVRRKNTRCLKEHQTFMDNGDLSNVDWLVATYPDARFVMNTRPLLDAFLSNYDMKRENRLCGKCSGEGTKASCPSACLRWAPKGRSRRIEMSGNALGDMAQWVTDQAEHHDKVLEFFAQHKELAAKRFVVVDVCSAPPKETMRNLMWVVRKDSNQDPLDGTTNKAWSAEVSSKYEHVADQTNVVVAKNNTRPNPHWFKAFALYNIRHPEHVVRRVREMLNKLGCGNMYHHRWYGACARKIACNGFDPRVSKPASCGQPAEKAAEQKQAAGPKPAAEPKQAAGPKQLSGGQPQGGAQKGGSEQKQGGGPGQQSGGWETCDGLRDGDDSCQGWAALGECDSNPAYMNDKCELACCELTKFDGEGVPSDYAEIAQAGGEAGCPSWCASWSCEGADWCAEDLSATPPACKECKGLLGHLQPSPAPTLRASPTPAHDGKELLVRERKCEGMTNTKDDCDGWALNGECKSNRQFMASGCALSCCRLDLSKARTRIFGRALERHHRRPQRGHRQADAA